MLPKTRNSHGDKMKTNLGKNLEEVGATLRKWISLMMDDGNAGNFEIILLVRPLHPEMINSNAFLR